MFVKDSVVQISVAGFVGALVMDLLMYLISFFEFNVTLPWQIAADVFLTANYINTLSGVILGLIGTVALNTAGALFCFLVFRITGYDYAILKGILTFNAFSFISMGLFMPLLKISPQIQSQPLTNFVALAVLIVTGAVVGVLLRTFHKKSQRISD